MSIVNLVGGLLCWLVYVITRVVGYLVKYLVVPIVFPLKDIGESDERLVKGILLVIMLVSFAGLLVVKMASDVETRHATAQAA